MVHKKVSQSNSQGSQALQCEYIFGWIVLMEIRVHSLNYKGILGEKKRGLGIDTK